MNVYPGFNHPTWFVPKCIYEQYGLYSLDYAISSDYEYYLRLMKNNVSFHCINEPIVSFRSGGISNSTGGVSEDFQINKLYFGFLKSIMAYSKTIILKRLQHLKEKIFSMIIRNRQESNKLLCFIHIERSAGTTFDSILINNLGYYYNLESYNPMTNTSKSEFYPIEFQNLVHIFPFVKGIGGHSLRCYKGYEKHYPNMNYITFLRDPVSRYLSHYSYRKYRKY